MNKGKMITIAYILSGAMLLGACRGAEGRVSIIESSSDGEVKIPILLRIDPGNDAGDYSALIKGFNDRYEGCYEMDVTLIAENEQGYRERIKLLNATDKLPAIITDASFGSEFSYIMDHDKRYHDLYPLGNGLYSSAGIYYNRDIFDAAGIDSYPETWDEFFRDLKRISDAGYTPIALHGGGDYWCSMLLASAYAADSRAGQVFLGSRLPASYDTVGMKRLLYCMDRIYDYSFDDALDISFEEAKDRFAAGEAAIFPNGYWMVSEFQRIASFDVDFAAFPGDIFMVDDEMSAWAITSGYSEEVTRGAELFMDYRQEVASKDYEAGSGGLDMEYKKAFAASHSSFPNYQLMWSEKVIREGFDACLPNYIRGDMDADELIKEFNTLAGDASATVTK